MLISMALTASLTLSMTAMAERDTATVNVTVNAVNDAPIVDGVTAANEMVDPAGTLNGLSEITVSAWGSGRANLV